ncbi:hypothetical protein I4U23_004354 [Adineta vaga]|nr:hypothetical protein I4U23_004354 [Adineta vaga]
MTLVSTKHLDTAAILRLTEGVDFRVISQSSGTTMKDFICHFFKQSIFTNPDKISLEGEYVLSTLHATKMHPDSYHLIYTQLRFAAGMIHGFKGKEFAAISTHYTDAQEATQITSS